MVATLSSFVAAHTALVLAFVAVTGALIYTELARLTRGYRAISPAQVTDLINRENALVVDIRALADFEKGHIVGARHMVLSQFDPENKALAKVKDLPVVLVCRTGITVAGAAKRLVKAGFSRVHVLDGGIAAWQQADLPLARGKDR
jgi:rhodanese-related sulfurtransferase